jgi:MFS family permease
VNTLFLLEAGLSNTQAFLANTFFTIGQVVFEIPTGIVADLKGRRVSYLLGTVTLAASTLIYLSAWMIHAPFLTWIAASILLGLGFTFFSGATEAWLVDALEFAGFKGSLESVFAKGQMVSGGAMLFGSVAGGVVAQFSNLGVPYILRAVLLVVTFGVAFALMKDWGYTPKKSVNIGRDIQQLFVTSWQQVWRQPAIRWIVFGSPFAAGVGFYTFYAMQPYLLELYGDKKAYAVAGLAAAIVAGSQILGSFLVPQLKKIFKKRTSVILFSIGVSAITILAVGLIHNFIVVIGLLCLWGIVSALAQPVRQAYLNHLIPSQERATMLSFDSVVNSAGGAVIQPALGKTADLWSYGTSFVVGAIIQVFALPLIWLAQKHRTSADKL